MTRFIGITLLAFVAFAGWKIGENLSTDASAMLLGFVFALMAGIPAALIAFGRQNKRLDVYHHIAEKSAQPTALAVRPQRLTVLDESKVHVLPVAKRGQLEVQR